MSVELDATNIAQGLRPLFAPGWVTELRGLNYQRTGTTYSCTMSGYFNDLDALAVEAAKLSALCSGVYFVPNPVNTDLLARVCNKVKPMGKGDATTADRDVLQRQWLLIDCDPQRVSGISATDPEKELAFDRTQAIIDYLQSEGWPEPVFADSGNGAHLMYRIDEPTEDNGLIKTCLEALAQRFNDNMVHVDTTVFNPARIWKLYGTLARKGDNVPDRPHRLSGVICMPEPLAIVTTEQLQALAKTKVMEITPRKQQATSNVTKNFNLEAWISTYLPDAKHKNTSDGDVWTISVCPFNPEHNRNEAFIIQRNGGIIGAGCKHEHCTWDWHELRALLEPEYQANQKDPTARKPIQDRVLSDLSNAERLIAAHGENLRYDVNRGAWLIWNSKRWEYDLTGEVNRLAQEVVRGMYALLPGLDRAAADAMYSHIKKSESEPRLNAMISLARTLQGVPVQAADLDHDPMLLNCLNGTVDLRSGTLRPNTREDLITKLAPVEYDPQAQCPRWMQFLSEVFQGNADIVGFVKRMAGYCLTGDISEQTAFILSGKGANGKSTLVEVLGAVTGDYAANTPFSTFLERRDSNTADLASLIGKRLVTASEGEEGASFNESLLKTLTGGDKVTCRHLYHDFFSYTPSFKVLFSTNEIPRIKSQNYAMKRRIKLIPFRQRFYDPHEGKTPVKDPALMPRLLSEKNGILAWAVQGCLEWRKNGLDTPDVIRAEVEALFESQDPLSEWLETECELIPRAEEAVGDLWKNYQLWCDENGRKPAFKQTQGFSRFLQQRDGVDLKRIHGGGSDAHRHKACKWW